MTVTTQPSPPPSLPPSSLHEVSSNPYKLIGNALPLRIGDRGAAVLDLQHRLGRLGFVVDGEQRNFGLLTEAALRRFQSARGLVVDGVCDVASWRALVEAAHRLGDRLLYYRSPMMRGDDVEDLQRRLGSLGFDAHWIDGIFGPKTHAATSRFQQNVGLPQDGVVGHSTVQAIERLTGRSTGAVTVAAVREQETLRTSSAGVASKRIVVGDTGQLPAIVQAIARMLRHAGAEVITFSTPDLSHQAAIANKWNSHVYCGLTLVNNNFGISYFAMNGYESVGGRALADYCCTALRPLLPETAHAIGLRLPILRETRMPAVWCRLGAGSTVVIHAQLIARSLVEAVTLWCRHRFD